MKTLDYIKTIKISFGCCIAFFIAVFVAILFFPFLNYSLLSLGIYLAVYQLLCQFWHLTEGISMGILIF